MGSLWGPRAEGRFGGPRRVLGDDLPMGAIRRERLAVRGMDTPGCEGVIVRSLGPIEGVLEVEADRAAGTVTVRFDPSRVGVEAIRERLRRAGFEPA